MKIQFKLILLFLGIIQSNNIIQASQKSLSPYSPNSTTGRQTNESISPLHDDTSPREMNIENVEIEEPYFAVFLDMIQKETWDSNDFHCYFTQVAPHKQELETKKFKIFYAFNLQKYSIKIIFIDRIPLDEPDAYGCCYKFNPAKHFLYTFDNAKNFYDFADKYQLRVR